MSRRLLPEAVPDALPGLLLRAERLLLQAAAMPRAREVLRSERLLLQAPAAHSAALPDAELHLRPASDLQLSEWQLQSPRGPVKLVGQTFLSAIRWRRQDCLRHARTIEIGGAVGFDDRT